MAGSIPVKAQGSGYDANLGRFGWACLSGTDLAIRQAEKALTAAFPLVRGLSMLVGDTGFEPVTSSV